MVTDIVRQRRLVTAIAALPTMCNELQFERVSIAISADNKHWQFSYGSRCIADYWPAAGIGQIVGDAVRIPCNSPAQAMRLAMRAKRQLFARIAARLRSQHV